MAVILSKVGLVLLVAGFVIRATGHAQWAFPTNAVVTVTFKSK